MKKVEVIWEPAFRLEPVGYRLCSPAAVVWRGRPLVVPRGMVTDFASVPRMFRCLIDNDEYGIRLAALLHDAAYRGELVMDFPPLTRKESDRMFYEVAVHRGLPRRKAWICWAMIRLFGRRRFRGA